MLSQLRAPLAPIRRALAWPLAASGVSPDAVSLSAVPLALVAAGLGAAGWRTPACCVALLSLAVDFLDGEVARLQNRVTPFGNCFEAVVDRLVEGILLMGLAPAAPLSAMAALCSGYLVSYVKARAGLVMVSDNRDWPGMGDRADRCLLILLALALPAWQATWVLAALTVVSLTGTAQRLAYARKLLAQAEKDGQLLPYLQSPVQGQEAGRS